MVGIGDRLRRRMGKRVNTTHTTPQLVMRKHQANNFADSWKVHSNTFMWGWSFQLFQRPWQQRNNPTRHFFSLQPGLLSNFNVNICDGSHGSKNLLVMDNLEPSIRQQYTTARNIGRKGGLDTFWCCLVRRRQPLSTLSAPVQQLDCTKRAADSQGALLSLTRAHTPVVIKMSARQNLQHLARLENLQAYYARLSGLHHDHVIIALRRPPQHAEQAPPSHLLSRPCKLSWRQTSSSVEV